MTTTPSKPYIFREGGRWVVQWCIGTRVRRVRSFSFRVVCGHAATVRRWQERGTG